MYFFLCRNYVAHKFEMIVFILCRNTLSENDFNASIAWKQIINMFIKGIIGNKRLIVTCSVSSHCT